MNKTAEKPFEIPWVIISSHKQFKLILAKNVIVIDYKLNIQERHMDFKTKYFAIWQEAWGLHKKYWRIPLNDSELWEQFAAEAEVLRSRYVGTPEEHFAGKLILAVTNEVENASKTLE